MKRDMDLCRKILLATEEMPPNGEVRSEGLAMPLGIDANVIDYHITLLVEAGLVDGIDVSTLENSYSFIITRLTWEGHEFLDSARDDGHWSQAKGVAEKAGAWGFSAISNILASIATEAWKQQLGTN